MEFSPKKQNNIVTEDTRKLIAKYSAMNIDTLGRHIAGNISHYKIDYLFNIFNELFGPTNRNIAPAKYPKIYEGNSEFVNYISEVQSVLCNNEWLCRKMKNIAHLSYEEQILHISRAISTNSALEKWRVSALPVAVLIIKIGVHKFCGCTQRSTVE